MLERQVYHPDLLIDFHDLILREFGLDLAFEEKPMKTFLDILDERQVSRDMVSQNAIVPLAIDPADKATLEYQLLMLIKPSRFDSIKKLVDLAKVMKHSTQFKNPVAVWLELCEKVKQTDLDTNINRWNIARKGSNTVKTIHYLAKLDDKDKYYELCQQRTIRDLFKDDRGDIITVQSRYLLDQTKKLDDDTTLCDQLKRLYTDANMKYLTLKSPMDTG